ncbi:EamA family transporter RarD [Dongshaea marina]|uniref:EamA family transporter RarD n=1 Tax=Dongshaea marina TaxID=2047966 RepID=UPI0019024ABB|nr:EamA family transporter RarD [Dongshaea marina]
MNEQTRLGIIYAIAGYVLWGLAPIYYKIISEISPLEILSNRVIWSFVLLVIIVVLTRQGRQILEVLMDTRRLLLTAGSALLLGVNWLIFIWAINNGHMLESSLGYYINPLFSVVLGVLFFHERLHPWQAAAVILAFVGVMIQVVSLGEIPWVSLGLAFTFGIYGLLRKSLKLGAVTGLLFETAIMLPIALVYLKFIDPSHTSNFLHNSSDLNLLLMAAGVITVLPLLGFTAAATRLDLSLLGFFQYLSPTIVFFLAITFYGEQINPTKMVTFSLIWLALVIFSIGGVKKARLQHV